MSIFRGKSQYCIVTINDAILHYKEYLTSTSTTITACFKGLSRWIWVSWFSPHFFFHFFWIKTSGISGKGFYGTLALCVTN